MGFEDDKGVVIVFDSQETINEYWRAIVAKDLYFLVQNVEEGRAFIVDSGTKVRILDFGFKESGIAKGAFLNYQVRILEGDYAGNSGWVAKEWVR